MMQSCCIVVPPLFLLACVVGIGLTLKTLTMSTVAIVGGGVAGNLGGEKKKKESK